MCYWRYVGKLLAVNIDTKVKCNPRVVCCLWYSLYVDKLLAVNINTKITKE